MNGEPSEFRITLPITDWVRRSVTHDGQKSDWLMLEGWASDTSRDQKGGVFSENAIIGMVSCVNRGQKALVWRDVRSAEAVAAMPVGIDIEHSEHWTDQIGYAVEAKAVYDLTDEQIAAGMRAPAMHVKCAVDLGMSHGRDLETALARGAKLGLSVFGGIEEGWTEISRSGERTDRFEKVALRRIAITQKPANKNMWLEEVKRSMEGVSMEVRDNQEATPADVLDEVAAPGGEPSAETAEVVAQTEGAEGAGAEVAVSAESVEQAAPVVEAPVEAPALSAEVIAVEQAPPTVARSEFESQMEVYRSEFATVRQLLAPLPALIDRLESSESNVSRAESEIGALRDQIRALSEDIAAIRARTTGRRGLVVSRSETEEAVILGSELKSGSPERLARIEEIRRTHGQAAAMNYIMGNLTAPAPSAVIAPSATIKPVPAPEGTTVVVEAPPA